MNKSICIHIVMFLYNHSFMYNIYYTFSAYVDYIPLNEEEVVFKSGASWLLNSTSWINFTIIDDVVVENSETVPLSLSSTLHVNTLQASSTAAVIIYDPLDHKLWLK